MTRADVKVGFACNNRCIFCAQGDKRTETGMLPVDELDRRLKAAFRPKSGLVLTGGEPTLHRHLAAVVRRARALGYDPIQVQTNGRMLAYPALIERLVEAGVAEFAPSLHGPDASVHDGLTRAPGSFDESVRGIENAVRSGARVLTNTVVVRSNLPHLDATLALLARLGVKKAQLALVHPVGTAALELSEVPPIELAARYMAAAVRAGRALGMDIVTEAVPACLMRGLEDAIAESRIPETTVVDADGSPFAFSVWRRSEGKAKGPECKRCRERMRCEGPWREYPARDGWSAYEPIPD